MSDESDSFLRRLADHGGVAIATSWMTLEEIEFARTNLREIGDSMLIPGTNIGVVRCDTTPEALVMTGNGKTLAFKPRLRPKGRQFGKRRL